LSRWQGHWWDGDLYDYLRQGLKAVPETGSAKTAFGQYAERCRVFGKTGTAETGKQAVNTAFNTAWFIGWREDKDQRPDYAFACMVTHAYKPYRTGGSVCAPIVANFLKEMDKLSANQPVQE
jgi:cell division protein FtsI/penicillin-binding protein 2